MKKGIGYGFDIIAGIQTMKSISVSSNSVGDFVTNPVINNASQSSTSNNNHMEVINKMKINVHAGHNPSGKTGCGAVGILDESKENRIVKDKVIAMLKAQGHTVYDCTVNNGISQNDVLNKIVSKCNEHTVHLDISIHFNSGAKDKEGNRKTTGTEVFVYSPISKAQPYARKIVDAISALGFHNRGVKYSSSLYFLRKTKSPALLIECCFVDDFDDAALYNADKMAMAIVKGITGIVSSIQPVPNKPSSSNEQDTYQVKLLTNLNIRKSPNGTIVQKGGAKKGIIYTIVETSGTWGRLKSNAGWISVSDKYVTKF